MSSSTNNSVSNWRLRQNFLRFFVFCNGAAVMAVEFSAQRLLEPFFGNSEIVWATLIGLILLALSAGYALGGRIADKWPVPKGMALLTVFAGIFVALLPLLANPLLSSVSGGLLNTPSGLVIASLLGTAALFVPPVIALGAVSPYALRLLIRNTEMVGHKTGSLYFWSTFGSLVGTFLPTLYTIPTFGVRATIWISATILLLLGLGTLGTRIYLILSLLPLAASQLAPPVLKPVHGLIKEVETPYQFAEVYKINRVDTALSVNDSAGIQSIYTPGRLTGLYYDAFLILPFIFPRKQPVNTLLIGMAAGTIPTMYARDVDPFRAAVPVTGVEIDQELVNLGKKYFDLKPAAAHVINADGRVYVRTSNSKFSMMIVDAYSQEIYIPFYLTTKEFFQECLTLLNSNGILAINVNSTSPSAPLLEAIERTLETVFPHVYLAKAPGEYNELLVASRNRVELPPISALPPFLGEVRNSLASTWHTPNPGKGPILTDDHAPVQEMTNAMIFQQLGAKK